jgi:3-isopropylmalate/(R)-2-methylmalate dehydratase large subunit
VSPRRKIPTKIELLQLQKIYKTDERIGEYLGGVPPYLVAYWRRKKNVPRHSVPKFSEKEIRDLWERFGDDDKCGLELSISKAAFYNWRRRYGIREKPAFLKLEQLELAFPGVQTSRQADTLYGKQTVVQKILARAAGTEKVAVGEAIRIEPDLVVVTGNAGAIIKKFRQFGSEYVWNPNKIVVSPAACSTPVETDNHMSYKAIRDFVRRQGIRAFYDFRDGFSHQVVIEKAHVLPGQIALASDGHATSLGCLGNIAGSIDPDQAAHAWAKGEVELTVPPSMRIEINGRRSRGVYTKDIVLTIIKQLKAEGAAGKAVEFAGAVVSHMSISERFTLADLAMDMGARLATTPFDSITRRYLTEHPGRDYVPVTGDRDAVYDGMYQINIDQLVPQVAGPDRVDNVKAAAELEGLAIHQVVLGTCSNGRFDDLRIAAEILKGKHVHADCRLLVLPASRAVFLEGLKKGLIRVLVEAGAVIMNPGCTLCFGGGSELFSQGLRTLATSDGSFMRAKGEALSEVYLCSPATAAASAINAAITDPTRYLK